MRSAHRKYIATGRSRIEGWFSRVDAEIFYLITAFQNVAAWEGGVAEIGLHHGKSFIALCMSLKAPQRAYGIDIFDNQSLNLDQSGSGNRAIVTDNLIRAGVDLSSVILDGRSSNEVTPEDILQSVGRVRFFSVDGGHWADIVRCDLRLAEQTMATHGVIALDDFLRPEWPDVSAGYFMWLGARSRPIVPFAIGFNKLYLCDASFAARYQEALSASPFLNAFISKHYDFGGINVPIYQRSPVPEWGWKTRISAHLQLYHPELYVRLKAVKSSFFKAHRPPRL
jgi:Methyltransferase domain